MPISLLRRGGVVLLLLTLVSGCALPGRGGKPKAPDQGFNACTWNPKACLYEGAYEPGERDYAEEEAKRLNQAEQARLRRSLGN